MLVLRVESITVSFLGTVGGPTHLSPPAASSTDNIYFNDASKACAL